MLQNRSKRPLIMTAIWLAIAIGAIEFLTMLLMQQFKLPQLAHAGIDSLVLIILVSPILYYFITRHRQIKEELTVRAELLDRAGDSISVMDLDRNIRYVNETFCRTHGYTKEEIIGMNIAQLDTRAVGGMEDPVARGLEDSGEIVFEATHFHKDGSELAFEIHSRNVEIGDSRFIMNIDREITERKQAEAALTDEATRRRILIEQSRDGIVVLDQDGYVQEANQRFAEMLGYSHEEILQVSVWDWEFLFPREQVLEMFKTIDEAGDHFETKHRRKDGTIFDVAISTNAAVFAGKKLIFCVCRDITKRKRMEQELQEKNQLLQASEEKLQVANEELEDRVKERTNKLEAANRGLRDAQEQLVRSEKLAAIGQLAGGVGHELRNPLGAIKNAVYYVRRKVAKSELVHSEPRVIEFLDIVDDEIDSSNKIINDLLGFSRVGKPTVSPTRIEEVVEAALSLLPIPDNIELVMELAPDLPEIQVDPDQIQQVLVNVISNALQAMPEGGRLTTAAARNDGGIEIQISDTGCGMTGEIKEKIFDPLFTMKAKGIGLGLAVSKSIIDRHEGRIEVESQEGKGSTFTINIPLSVNQVPAAP